MFAKIRRQRSFDHRRAVPRPPAIDVRAVTFGVDSASLINETFAQPTCQEMEMQKEASCYSNAGKLGRARVIHRNRRCSLGNFGLGREGGVSRTRLVIPRRRWDVHARLGIWQRGRRDGREGGKRCPGPRLICICRIPARAHGRQRRRSRQRPK